MKCSTVRDELSRYVEGALSGDAQAALAQHLAACPACRAEAEAYQRAEEALRSLAAVVAAPELTADLRRRLSAPPPRPLRWVWAGAALAAVAAAAALLALRTPAPPAPRETMVRQPVAADSHPQQFAVEPVTEQNGVPRPTAPPHPSPALVPEQSTGRHGRVRRLRHDAPPQVSSQDVALQADEALAVPTPRLPARRPVGGLDSSTPQPDRPPTPDGIVLLISAPQPALPAANCRVQVSLPDGSTSVREQIAAPDAAGEERVVRVTYQTTGPHAGPEWRPQ